ncbi:MAG: GNAT family N-acetyltransferase [Proteobacteria bacterium]|nr:GNAT family N-acetyltransferase [Pseudomonadota bacterium]
MPEYKNFSFPLNVYSHVLHLDYGGFQYLHYGMFGEGQKNLIAAQENASKLLFSRLPPRPCRILEVGIGTGATLSSLAQAGYEATGITPDESQILYAKSIHGNGMPVVCKKFEDFIDGRTFDLIIFQESAQYIDTATLFQKASSLLNAAGRIIIMDEVSLGKDSLSSPGLPPLDGYLSLGEKFGFDIEERLDLTALATPTNAYILDAVTRHRARLIQDLDLASAEIDGLLDSAKAYCRKYTEGRYGYCLLDFKKKPSNTDKLLVDWAGPADEAELLALFRRAFGTDMPAALWRWKYAGLDTPGALARRDGRAVAFYGGIPRTVSLFGSPATAVQIGDVMVDPAERGVLTRRGPFFLAASHYLRHCVGEGRTFPLAFGFPSQRAYRLGERLGLYAKVGEIMRVEWPALQTWPSLLLRTRPWASGMAAAADRLWLEMAAALSREIVGVRDFAYLKRRYLEHPALNYKVFGVSSRLSAKPFGIIVVREEGEELLWVDVVAPPERIAALVTIVRRLATDLGKPKAYTWITAQNAALFAGESGVVSPTEIVIPALDWNPAFSAAELADHWWLMAGDTDFR